jgi:DNA polymerase I-like protein with 3'-5' exonuclease and polymerase domains
MVIDLSEIPVLDLEWDANDPGRRLLTAGYGGRSYGILGIRGIMNSQDLHTKMAFTREDHRFLEGKGIHVGGTIVDVQTMAWTYDERTPLSLDWLAKHYVGIDPDKRLVRKGGKVLFRCDDGEEVLIADAPIDQLRAYNIRDLDVTELLAIELQRRLVEQGRWYHFEDEQVPFTRVLLDMELNGLPIDVEALDALHARLADTIEFKDLILRQAANIPDTFNLNSGAQIAKLLFTTGEFTVPDRYKVTPEEMQAAKEDAIWPDHIPLTFEPDKLGRDYIHGVHRLEGLGLKAKVKAPQCKAGTCGHTKNSDHLPSTSTKVLKVFHGDNEWVGDYVDYRTTVKAQQFLSAWQEAQVDGRLYARFNQTGTATGRLSSSNPNLQNIPARGDLGKEIRGLFRAKPGHVIVQGDYGQIEPRLMAHFSGDPVMRGIFQRGEDIYVEMTEAVLGKRYEKNTPERKLVQITFLAMGYGAQPPKIRSTLAEAGFFYSLAKVEQVCQGLRKLFAVYWAWADAQAASAKVTGYITTIGGHRRHLDFGKQSWKADRQAVNSLIQGSAADIVRRLMMQAHEAFPEWRMVAQVHDEVLWEVREDLANESRLADLAWMAREGHGYDLNVHLVFDPQVVQTWAEAK